MSELNETIFCRWIEEVWNEGKETTIDELFAEKGVAEYPYNIEHTTISGREEYKKFVRFIRGFFTDIRVTIEQIASDKDKVIALCTFTANRRSIETKGLSVHSPIRVSGLCQMIFENGLIIRAWCNVDLFGKTAPKNNSISEVI